MTTITDFIHARPLASWVIAAMIVVHLAVWYVARRDDSRKD